MSSLTDLLRQGLINLYLILPNWGFAIAVFALLIRAILFPLQLFTLNQQAKLKRIKPQLDAYLQIYKGDLPRYISESRALKKQVGFKGGLMAIATLVQVPIFIGMYQVMTKGNLFSGEGFFWIKPLISPDPFFILPAVMGVLVYLQVRNNQNSETSSIPNWILPVATGVINVRLPAALVIFYIMNSFFQMIGQRLSAHWV